MSNINRYNGRLEFEKILKTFAFVPSNTEIVEKTGVSKGSVSEIMNGIRPPSKNFIEKFKKGFGIKDIEVKEKPLPDDNGLYLSVVEHRDYLLKEVEFLRAMLLKK